MTCESCEKSKPGLWDDKKERSGFVRCYYFDKWMLPQNTCLSDTGNTDDLFNLRK